jgi:NAD(P)-dependent dehydrogenase (short-subunit alcohol dehydrogenase family)
MNIRELFSLENKCAVVIGGAGKIGLPMTEGLAEAGARVYIASRNMNQLEDTVKKLKEKNLAVEAIEMDQSNEENVLACIESIKKSYKTPDILINSGVERPMKKYFDDEIKNWDRSMEVNSRGLFITCRAFSREMMKNQGGSIINIASIYGMVAPDLALYDGTDFQTEPDYPYTKGGMIMFSKYLASFLAKKNVRVNCIAPGGYFNNQGEPFYSQYIKKVPMARMANHDDLKGVAVFLASEASRYITGSVIPVDGGFTTI